MFVVWEWGLGFAAPPQTLFPNSRSTRAEDVRASDPISEPVMKNRGQPSRPATPRIWRILDACEFELLVLLMMGLVYYTIRRMVSKRAYTPLLLPFPFPHTTTFYFSHSCTTASSMGFSMSDTCWLASPGNP